MRELVYISINTDTSANSKVNDMEALRKRFAEQGLPFVVCDSLQDMEEGDRLIAAYLEEYSQQTVTSLINEYNVGRIYLSDLDAMIDDLQNINHLGQSEDTEVLKGLVRAEEELMHMQDRLTDALKKQQYSYNKLHTLYSTVLAQASDANHPQRYELLCRWFDFYLRLHTTGTLDMSRFEEEIQNDLSHLQEQYPNLVVTQIQNCLSNVTRARAADIRFIIFCIAEYSCLISKRCSYQVKSEYLTPTRACFEMRSDLESGEDSDLQNFIRTVLNFVADTVEFASDEHQLLCKVEFSTI